MAMGRTVRIVLWVFAVWAAVALCRTCWLTLVEVPQACMQPSFLAGDRLLVDRWQCGFRVPFMDFHACCPRTRGWDAHTEAGCPARAGW